MLACRRKTCSTTDLLRALLLTGCIAACSGGGPSTPTTTPTAKAMHMESVVSFHCALNTSCPALIPDGDPEASFANNPAPFRGYGDPSLSYEESTDTLWMSYSWLSTAVEVPGPPVEPDFLVRTHLASSSDGGRKFQFVRSINTNQKVTHPDTAEQGWLTHEVSTMAQQPDGAWQLMWLQYFDPHGKPERKDFILNRTVATSPASLGESIQPWIRTAFTGAAFGAPQRLSDIHQLRDCTAFTEPDLFTQDNNTYLAMNCVVIERGKRAFHRERLFVLRQNGDSYDYLGVLVNSEAARSVGGDVVEQADIAVGRDGKLLLLVTPINHKLNPPHQGCVALEVDALNPPSMARAADNSLVVRASIRAEADALGPGLCTYHARSETGIIVVVPRMTSNPTEIVFSMRSTGIHP